MKIPESRTVLLLLLAITLASCAAQAPAPPAVQDGEGVAASAFKLRGRQSDAALDSYGS